MHAAILHVLEGDPDGTLGSQLGDGLPAAEVESTQYLDGSEIYHGTLAGELIEDTEVPHVDDSGIRTESVTSRRQVTTDFYADLEHEWAGVDASDGVDVLEGYLLSEVAVVPQDSEIRLDAWAESFDEDQVWNVTYSQSTDDGFADDRAAAKYHADVDHMAVGARGKSVLGFDYGWDGRRARGVLTASGYLAIYRDWPIDTFGAFVAEEVAPYLQVAADDQETLPGKTCSDCGRVSDSVEDGGLCIVCADAADSGGEA